MTKEMVKNCNHNDGINIDDCITIDNNINSINDNFNLNGVCNHLGCKQKFEINLSVNVESIKKNN